jgi:uncharacterized protein YecT (DUF1311 family)
MKTLSGFSTALCLAFVVAAGGCREEKKKPEVAQVPQDTMLLRDLAEANKNTAANATLDNSLSTVNTSGDGTLPAMANGVGQSAPPETRVVARPTPNPNAPLTSGSRMSPPLKANDAPGATTVAAQVRAQSSSSGDPCDSPAAVDQRSCLNRSIVQNDADLNRTYQDLLAQARKSGGSDLEDRFRQSQREWVNTRDSDCVNQTQGQGGALWARARARCLADYSSKRTAELQRNLNSLRGQ